MSLSNSSSAERGPDIIDQLAGALGQERADVMQKLTEDRAALASQVMQNPAALTMLRIRPDASSSVVERRLAGLARSSEFRTLSPELAEDNVKTQKESFLKKIVMAPVRGLRRLAHEVVFHPIRTGVIALALILGYKYLKDSIYHRAMSDAHLLASDAGRINLRRDVDLTTRTLGGEHRTPPMFGRGDAGGGSLPGGGYSTGRAPVIRGER